MSSPLLQRLSLLLMTLDLSGQSRLATRVHDMVNEAWYVGGDRLVNMVIDDAFKQFVILS